MGRVRYRSTWTDSNVHYELCNFAEERFVSIIRAWQRMTKSREGWEREREREREKRRYEAASRMAHDIIDHDSFFPCPFNSGEDCSPALMQCNATDGSSTRATRHRCCGSHLISTDFNSNSQSTRESRESRESREDNPADLASVDGPDREPPVVWPTLSRSTIYRPCSTF